MGRKVTDEFTYKRIRLDILNIKTLKALTDWYWLKSSVIETDDFFVKSYPRKPDIYISKKDGRLYALKDDKESRVHAVITLRILTKIGHVEGYKRKQTKVKHNCYHI